MIEVSMRQKNMSEAAKPEPAAHQLALRTLAAIDEIPTGALGDEHSRQASVDRGHRRSGAEKGQFEHGISLRPPLCIKNSPR